MSDDEINELVLGTSKEELVLLVKVAELACMHDLIEKITNHLESLKK